MEQETAQDIINQSEDRSEELFKLFYPEKFKQVEADHNISKCLRELG